MGEGDRDGESDGQDALVDSAANPSLVWLVVWLIVLGAWLARSLAEGGWMNTAKATPSAYSQTQCLLRC